ncbi:MAG: DUF6338 family protein [Planctomycetes bacterium]|nr:DUF6338 family protein [Planctomycetota bacterium]
MTFETFDAILWASIAIVPGFIFSGTLSMLIPRSNSSLELRAKEYFTLSCINYGIWVLPLMFFYKYEWIDEYPKWSIFGAWCAIFVSPIVLGLIFGYISQRNLPARFLGRFGFRTISPIPRAWDSHFSRMFQYYVIVTLKNDTCLYGLYGVNSIAGSDPNCRDIYLETVFDVNEEGEWILLEDSRGAWIAEDQISFLEFIEYEEVNDGANQKERSESGSGTGQGKLPT